MKLKNPLKSCEIPKEETNVQLVVKCDQFVCLAKLESCNLAVMFVQCFKVVKCCIILDWQGLSFADFSARQGDVLLKRVGSSFLL